MDKEYKKEYSISKNNGYIFIEKTNFNSIQEIAEYMKSKKISFRHIGITSSIQKKEKRELSDLLKKS